MSRAVPVALIAVGVVAIAWLALLAPSTPPKPLVVNPTVSTPAPSRPTLADAATCPVTKPLGLGEPGTDRPFASSSLAFGNAHVWVVPLQVDGIFRADSRSAESDGSLSTKFGWWRIASGTLVVTGHRLDASAPPLRATIPDGYGDSGYQSSGVAFPTEGCWELTGTAGSASLTFVLFVIRSEALSVTPVASSARSEGDWGPLAVVPPQDGADTVRTEGMLRITGSCAFLATSGGPVVLVWPADRTTWNAETQAITFANFDGSTASARDGARVVLGGGGDSNVESGTTNDAWLARTPWVARPDASCPLDSRWWVGALTP